LKLLSQQGFAYTISKLTGFWLSDAPMLNVGDTERDATLG